MKTAKIVLYCLCILTVIGTWIDLILWYPHLPQLVFTRFNLRGEPIAEMPRMTALVTLGITQGVIVGGLLAMVAAMPWFPADFLNIPNRDYWLAEPRAHETRLKIQLALLPMVLAMAMLMWTIAVFSFRVSVGVDQRLHVGFWPFVITLLLTVVWAIGYCIVAFRKPRNDSPVEQ